MMNYRRASYLARIERLDPLVVKAGVNLLKASIEDLGRTV